MNPNSASIVVKNSLEPEKLFALITASGFTEICDGAQDHVQTGTGFARIRDAASHSWLNRVTRSIVAKGAKAELSLCAHIIGTRNHSKYAGRVTFKGICQRSRRPGELTKSRTRPRLPRRDMNTTCGIQDFTPTRSTCASAESRQPRWNWNDADNGLTLRRPRDFTSATTAGNASLGWFTSTTLFRWPRVGSTRSLIFAVLVRSVIWRRRLSCRVNLLFQGRLFLPCEPSDFFFGNILVGPTAASLK